MSKTRIKSNQYKIFDSNLLETFDLNVKNYSLTELQSFFNMTTDNDQPLKDKCMILKKKI